MIRGLLEKTLRETWLTTLLFALGLMAVMGLLTFVLPQAQEGINEVLGRLPFAKALISALLGVNVGEEITAQLMQSILWVHPVVLALVWAYDIIFCTRIPAGEIDRGTIDLLLGLPVSRLRIYIVESALCLLFGALILGAGYFGHALLAGNLPDDMRPTARHALFVLINFYCLYLAIAALSLLVSAWHDRRGRAIGLVFALVLASFLVNFLVPLWKPAEQIAFLSLMHYYQPAQILRDGAFPWLNVLVLWGVAAVFWLSGGFIFLRRDVCTV
jgi:ABC-type transport system involved in multi-copper enzyme maturation permease subunit